jgi:trehalose 6-phosphate phosphatase
MAHVPSPGHPPLVAADNAVFLDVDGTLVGFADAPADVQLPAQVVHDIGVLQHCLGGALALISGRPLEQLDALLAPLRLPAAGLHGHQLRNGGHRLDCTAPSPHWLLSLRQRADALARQHPGLLVEDKGVGLALHWRTAPALGALVTAFAQAQLAPGIAGPVPAGSYRLQPGDHVIEFVPAGSDKGRALQQLMQQAPFAGRRPLCIGDDLTDEYAFAAAHQLGGGSILVGPRRPSGAHWQLADPGAVHAWLRRSAAALSRTTQESL